MRDWIILSIPHGAPTMAQIAGDFAERESVSVADLKGPSRVRAVARKRQRAYTEIYSTGRYSTTQIGLFFGGRDHTTVAHGIKRTAARAGIPPAPRNYWTTRREDLGLLAMSRALAEQEAA